MGLKMVTEDKICEIIRELEHNNITRSEREFEIPNTYPVSNPYLWKEVDQKKHKNIVAVLKKYRNSKTKLYFHVPFCNRKCKYCFYYTIQKKLKITAEKYLDSLKKEIFLIKEITGKRIMNVGSLYIGGGTPSYLSNDLLSRLFLQINREFPVLSRNYTWTFEVSPDTITKNKLSIIKKGGVNRISMGVECLNSDILRKLGRYVDTYHIMKIISLVLKSDFYLNTDLIYGLPGQTLEDWKLNIKQITSLRVPEITLYYLRINEKSILRKKPDDFWMKEVLMLNAANEILKDANYIQMRTHHWVLNEEIYKNLWYKYQYAPVTDQMSDSVKVGGKELGFGPSAISHIKDYVYWNIEDLQRYSKLLNSNILPFDKSFYLPERDKMIRYIINGIDKMFIDIKRFEKNFKGKLPKDFSKLFNFFKNLGLLTKSERGFILSDMGKLFYDVIEHSFITLHSEPKR